MNSTGISQFNQARVEWAIRLRYSPMPKLSMDLLASELNAFRIGELRTVGKTWEVMMERDGELAINSEKRKADSACLEWQISSDGSPDGDKHAAALQYFYNNLSATKALDQDATGGVDELVFQTLSAVDFYYSAHEMLMRVDNPAAKEVTAEFRHTPLWFFEARRGYLGYLKHIFDMYGQPCIAGEWLTAVNTGWLRQLTMPYCAKWNSMSDWLIFCRRYGSGFLEAISNATKDSQEWNDAAAALLTLSNEGTVLHNRDVEFKFVEQASRTQLPYQPVVELVDRLYAKCYRGVDLATGSRDGGAAPGGGHGARNPVGASVQKEESGILLVRDAKWITGVFNDRIDRPIIRYLFNEEPRAWFALLPPLDDTSSEDLQSLQTLVPMGLRVALTEVYKRFRWSVPGEGEPCLESPKSNGHPPSSDYVATSSPTSADAEVPSSKFQVPKSTSEDEDENEEDVKTQPAQTTETTPIAAGADPARNPGLINPQSPSRQMPDTQVDAGAFWSRVGLTPRGADGQTLPMPSLGYAVPNADMASPRPSTLDPLLDRHASLVARGLGNSRAAQALHREITRRRFELETRNQKPGTQGSLANAGFDPNEPRDSQGRWTSNGGSSATNNPAQTNIFAPEVARPVTTNSPSQTNLLAPDRLVRVKPDQSLITQLSAKSGPDPLAGVKLNPLEQAEVEGGPRMAREDYAFYLPPELNPNWDFTRYIVQHPLAPLTETAQALGTAGKAVVGDIAAKVGGYPDAGGNISAFLHGDELPLDRALRDSALEQNFRGEVPIATVMGRVSEGIASTLPLLPFMAAIPAQLQQAALATFTLRMAAETPEIARQLGEEYGKPPEQRDPDKIDKLLADAIQTIGFTAAGGVGLKRGLTPKEPPPKTPVQWREIQKPSQEPNTQSRQPADAPSTGRAPQKIQPESPGSEPTDSSRPAAPTAPSPKTEPTPSQKAAARLQANKAAGDAWEKHVNEQQSPQTQNDVRPQITIKSNGPSAKRVRADGVGTDKITGKIRVTDAKASPTAPLTPNQTVVYPELETHGGVVVGKGKPPYTGGTQIPPTKVEIIRKPKA
jgi:filamentous hemagglutinin